MTFAASRVSRHIATSFTAWIEMDEKPKGRFNVLIDLAKAADG